MASEPLESELETLTGFLYVVPVGLLQFNASGAVLLANPLSAQRLMPLSSNGEFTDAYSILHPLIPDLSSKIRDFRAPSGVVIDHVRCEVCTGGQETVLSVTVHRVGTDAYLAVLDDVTVMVAQERRIFEDQQRFRAIFDNVRDYAIYTVDDQGRIEGWNPSLERFGHWRPEDVKNRTLADLHVDLQEPPRALSDFLHRARQTGSAETEGWWLLQTGTRVWTNTILTAMPNNEGQVRGFVVVTRDMTERKRMEDELRRLASTDPLTGALNRRAGRALFKEAYGKASAEGREPGAIMIDIDHFKSINDNHGHDAGDAALAALVQLCGATLGERQPIIRWGGEEFVVLLAQTTLAEASAYAELLRKAVASTPLDTPAGPLTLTISAGVAVGRSHPDKLVHDADVALYRAKTGGRNRVMTA